MDHSVRTLRWLLIAVAAAVVAACASIGRPQGGPRDTEPPVYLKSNPMPGQTNVKATRITVDFNENVSIEDAMNRVVVSPAQRTMPSVSALGKRVTVTLRDTLIPDVTYTIDFSDAIKDLNEGNILDGLAFDFSTGDQLDTLRISGMVFEAATLEPAQGMLVGAYSNLDDSAITTLPLERITKTNQLGQFTLRGLKPVPYRIFAVDDKNRDYHWDRSENVAFYDTVITPSAMTVSVADTLEASDGTDSIVRREVTRFLPDDILLTWFNENYVAQYLADYKRAERNKIEFRFSAPADSLPIIRLLNTPRAGDEIRQWAALDASPTLDTLTYWITDTALIANDSILLEARYLRTDTLDRLSETTDTLKFFMRPQRNKKAPKKKKDEEADTVPPEVPSVSFAAVTTSTQELNRPLLFRATTPIVSIDPKGVTMEVQEDTLWIPVTPPAITMTDSLRPMAFTAPYKWLQGMKYRLTVDSAAVTDIYGHVNKKLTHEFTVKQLSDYSTVTFSIEGLDGRNAVVELLSAADKRVAIAPVDGSKAELRYLAPGSYYARLIVDRDSDDTFTTGNLASGLQPEEVYYYPGKLNLKKNWDVEQTWNIDALPVDKQKPYEIKKNKPKTKDPDQTGGRSDEEDEDDEFYNGPFMNGATPLDGRRTGSGSYR